MLTRAKRRTQRASAPAPFFATNQDVALCVAAYLAVRDVVALSSTNVALSTWLRQAPAVWRPFIHHHFGLVEAQAAYSLDAFRALAARRIWDWERVLCSRVFWARAAFSCSDELERLRVFGVSFAHRPDSHEVRKLDHTFEDWDDGHKLLLRFPSDLFLSFEVNDHTCGTWRLGKLRHGLVVQCYVLNRVDGHPVGPGFRYLEVKALIEYVAGEHWAQVPFELDLLWPLFFFAIARTCDLSGHVNELMEYLRCGWSALRLPASSWPHIRRYAQPRDKAWTQ